MDKKNVWQDLAFEAVIIYIIFSIIKMIIERTVNLFWLQQALIAASLVALAPIVMLVAFKMKIPKWIKRESFMVASLSIGIAGTIEIVKNRMLSVSIEIIAVLILMIIVYYKWSIIEMKEKGAVL